MSKNKLLICEPHQIIDASHELSLTEIRIIQLTLARNYAKGGLDKDKFYEIPLQEFADQFNLTIDCAYHALVDACKTLKTKILVIKSKLVDPNAGEKTKRIISWVDAIEYNPETHKVSLRWHQDIIPFFAKLGEDNPYSKYYLENTCRMQSIYSIRLYRLCNKWLRAQKLDRDVEEVRRLLGIGDESYTRFSNFRQKVIDIAVAEVNLLSNIFITYTVEYTGRQATKILFKVNLKVEEKVEEQCQHT
jgi:plasmid replication initiation protein